MALVKQYSAKELITLRIEFGSLFHKVKMLVYSAYFERECFQFKITNKSRLQYDLISSIFIHQMSHLGP